ncbi:hypothetical protein [Verrucomicrobium spinosum]|uniref:hypothetical protein n=1 Tax=Verrucomicrobium spinosum TaxID=2736 RepID=UPI0012E2D9B9|nr:hypothetical protein [Verrucomicrobium spinosum]
MTSTSSGPARELVINGGAHDKSLDLPTGGDRIRYGATRHFDGNVVNVLDAQNAIKLFGTGWETGDQVIFTTDGTGPAILLEDGTRSTLQNGGVYYVVRQGRDIIRLTDTKEKAEALAAYLRNFTLPDTGLNDNLITLLDGGRGNHQLTLASNGTPLLEQTVGGLIDGENGNPSRLVFNNPGTGKAISVNATTNTFTVADVSGLTEGRKVAFYAGADLPAGLKSEIFYTVVNVDAAAGTFQLLDPDPLAAEGAILDLSSYATEGTTYVTVLGTVDFTNVEKLNVLLGLGKDTWVMDNANNNLQVEVRGGPGDDEVVMFRMGNNTVIQGDQGEDDTLRVIVNGDPQQDQFARLVVGAGMERLSVDNSDNANGVDWYISQGQLYFGDGKGTATVATDDTFTSADFDGATPLAVGDRVLVSTVTVAITDNQTTADGLNVTRGGALPTYRTTGNPPSDILLDQGQFYYVTNLSGGRFELAQTLEDAWQASRWTS